MIRGNIYRKTVRKDGEKIACVKMDKWQVEFHIPFFYTYFNESY